MSNAALLMNLLGSFIGDSSPTRNPNYKGIDPNTGEYIGGEAPYSTPGFGTKMFHPDVAAQEGQLNNQGFNQQLSNTIAHSIAGRDFSQVRDVQGVPLTDKSINPNQAAILTGNNPTAAGMYGVNTLAAKQAANLPAIGASTEASQLTEAGQSANANIQAQLPSRKAAESGASADYGNQFYNDAASLIQPRSGNEGERIAAEQTLRPYQVNSELQSLASSNRVRPYTEKNTIAQSQLGTNEALRGLKPKAVEALNKIFGSQLATKESNANVDASLAGVREKSTPVIAQTLANQLQSERNRSIGDMANSLQVQPGSTPRLGGIINPDDDSISLGGANPFWQGPQGGYLQSMANGQGVTQSAPVVGNGTRVSDGGSPLPMVQNKIDARTGQPIHPLLKPSLAASIGSTSSKSAEDNVELAKSIARAKIRMGTKLTPQERALFSSEELIDTIKKYANH